MSRDGARLALSTAMLLMVRRPMLLLREQMCTLESHLGAVRDGDVEAIHEARVATRRIRELLPLIAEGRSDTADQLADQFRSVGRSLGDVRDADVQTVLLRSLETRIPGAAPTLVLLRQRHERHRLQLMRALIKEFERMEIERLVESVQHGVIRAVRHTAAGWDRRLRRLIADRAAGAREAIDYATGVYFPKRAHKARIAIKKFRYATEIATATGLWNAREIIRELKKGQELLGRVHDRQELLDGFAANDGSYPAGSDRGQLELVTQVVEAEAHDLHCRYLSRRQRLLDAALTAERAVSRARVPVFPAAGLLAASSALLLVRRRIAARAF